MIYGYARVSGQTQSTDGNSLDVQREALKNKGCQQIYEEIFTGTKTERPVFSELVGMLKSGDVLIMTKLDRFARTVSEGTTLVKQLIQRDVAVEIINMGGRIDNTPAGRLQFNMMMCFAEFERDMIVERMNEGKAIAKAKGKKTDGRYKKPTPDFSEYLQKQKDGVLSVEECCKALDISRSVWYSRIRELYA